MVPISARGDHRDLGRAALGVADEAQRQGVEQVDHAGVFEEGAEQDEQEDVGRRDQGRDAEDAFGAQRQLVDDLVEAVAAMREVARQVLAEQAVEQESAADDGQGQAEDAPRRLEGQDHQRVPTTRSMLLGSPERWIRSASKTQW
jgi:hypothetical protein